MLAAFFTGAVSIALFRILLRAVLLLQGVVSVMTQWHDDLAKHASNHWFNRHEHQSETPLETLRRCYYDIEVATYPYIGRHGTVLIYAACGHLYLALLGWITRNAEKPQASRKDTLLAAALIVIIVPVWYAVFAVHTMIHFWMTGRLLALFFSLAPSTALLLLQARLRRQPDWQRP